MFATIALRVGYFTNFAPVSTVRGGFELGMRARAGVGFFTAGLAADYYTASTAASDDAGTVSVAARLHAIPLALSVGYLFTFARFEPYVAVGGVVTVNLVDVRVSGANRLVSVLAPGAVGALGMGFRLGPGQIFAEASYTYSPPVSGPIELESGGLYVFAGYRLVL